jgi:hypothetical protein
MAGIIIEELVRESLGGDGHKIFIEDSEIESGAAGQTESNREMKESGEKTTSRDDNAESEAGNYGEDSKSEAR